MKRNREPEEDDAYGWWLMGIDDMVSGMGEVLRGMKHQRKAIGILAEKEKAAGRSDDD